MAAPDYTVVLYSMSEDLCSKCAVVNLLGFCISNTSLMNKALHLGKIYVG